MARLAHPPLVFDESGSPVSTLYGDVYRSRDGALAESRTVFVEGCGLPERLRTQGQLCVLEIGFGLGLNLLASVQALRQGAQSSTMLHFVSIEAHPLSADDLRLAHQALGVADDPLSAALVAAWPMALPGVHRITLEGGRVSLMLVFGDAARMLRRLSLRADALFLDGFSPARNPSAWEPRLFGQLARLAALGARLSTYSAAAAVREGLAHAGFEVHRVSGFGRKRERINAVYAPRWKTWAEPPAPPRWSEQHAVVVGAGLAGAAVSSRLAQRGWRVTLIDRNARPGQGGSSQPMVADHLHLSPDDNLLARLSRAAFLMRCPSDTPRVMPVGRIAVAGDDAEAERQRALIAQLGFPQGFARWVDADEATAIAGCRLSHGGLWMPRSWVADPAGLIAEQIASAGERLSWIGATTVASVRPAVDGNGYSVVSSDDRIVASAPVVVLCDAGPGEISPAVRTLPLRRVRGQTSWITHPSLAGLRTVLGGAAYAVPMGHRVLSGSTYDELDSIELDPESDRSNARRLAAVLGLDSAALDASVQSAALGFRWTTADRMPVIGPVPDEEQAAADRDALLRNDRLPLPRRAGIFCARAFGSRGLLWSELAAELIAAWVTGAPIPLERELLDAIDPARGVRAALRRGRVVAAPRYTAAPSPTSFDRP